MFTKTKPLTLAERVAQHDDTAARALDVFNQAATTLEDSAAGLAGAALEAREEAARLEAFATYATLGQAKYQRAAAKIRELTAPE